MGLFVCRVEVCLLRYAGSGDAGGFAGGFRTIVWISLDWWVWVVMLRCDRLVNSVGHLCIELILIYCLGMYWS